MTYLQELETIAAANNGLLRAADVIAFAVDESTALHSRFTWDDDEAAHQYRLYQARNLIRVTVSMLPRVKQEYRAFVSLKSDRYSGDGGGYRVTANVLSSKERRAELLENALEDLEVFQQKYRMLTELAPVFGAASQVAAQKRKASKAKES